MNWEKAPFGRSDYLEFEVLPPKPAKFDEMVKIAKSLSSGHPFLRVDLYEINNKVYFSELTFSPCAGFMPFVPEEWDAKLGKLMRIYHAGKIWRCVRGIYQECSHYMSFGILFICQ